MLQHLCMCGSLLTIYVYHVAICFFVKVEACRARLYKMASQDMKSGPTPKSTAAWRESCIKAIIPQVN